MDIDSIVKNTIKKILSDSQKDKEKINNDDVFTGNLGFDSLDLAVMVVILKNETGLDPFVEGGVSPVPTVGELISVYEKHYNN